MTEQFKAWLLQTRMARYPLATAAIIVAILAALWYMDPEFVRFLGTGAGQQIDEEQVPIDDGTIPGVSRVPQVVVDPKDPMSVVEHLYRVQRVVDGKLEFGSPQNPNDPANTTIANGTTHNGTIQNLLGSWFEISIGTGDLGVDQTCTHNLGVDLVSAALPVRWLVFGIKHNAAGVGAGSTVSAVYEGGAVTANAIDLRFYAAARTVNDANPMLITLWFIPAVR